MDFLRLPALLALLLACLTLSPEAARAGALIRQDFVCDLDRRNAPRVEEQIMTGGVAFRAVPEERAIYYNPRAIIDRPQPVVNYQFAEACLAYYDRDTDVCSIVRFLRERELIYGGDLSTLQEYFIAEAENTRDASERNRLFARVKELYACY